MLFCTETFHLLVEQTNLYCQQHLDGQAGPGHRLPDITLSDVMTFIASALQMGHKLKDTLHDYWSRLRQLQLHTPFYGETMIWVRFFTHTAFSASCRQFTETWPRLRIWPTFELRNVFDTLTEASAKFRNPSEHLAVHGVIVKFKGSTLPRKKNISASTFTNSVMNRYTCDMSVLR